MESLIAEVREEIDRRVRPGQRGATTVADRAGTGETGSAGSMAVAVVYEAETGTVRRYGRYGRAPYGEARYGGVG